MQHLDRPGWWHPSRGVTRLARAVTAGFISSATAWIAHDLAGGSVTVTVAVSMLIGASSVAWALASRRLSGGQLVGLLMLCQAVTHVACASQSDASMGFAMIAGHIMATTFSAALMARGERWLWAAAEFIRSRLTVALHVSPTPATGRMPVPMAPSATRHYLRVCIPFVRGPPVSTM